MRSQPGMYVILRSTRVRLEVMESFIRILLFPGGYAFAKMSNIRPNKQDILHMYFAHHSTATNPFPFLGKEAVIFCAQKGTRSRGLLFVTSSPSMQPDHQPGPQKRTVHGNIPRITTTVCLAPSIPHALLIEVICP